MTNSPRSVTEHVPNATINSTSLCSRQRSELFIRRSNLLQSQPSKGARPAPRFKLVKIREVNAQDVRKSEQSAQLLLRCFQAPNSQKKWPNSCYLIKIVLVPSANLAKVRIESCTLFLCKIVVNLNLYFTIFIECYFLYGKIIIFYYIVKFIIV
jgi:hypothetical protein